MNLVPVVHHVTQNIKIRRSERVSKEILCKKIKRFQTLVQNWFEQTLLQIFHCHIYWDGIPHGPRLDKYLTGPRLNEYLTGRA